MAERSINATGWYNKATYSDLTLALSDGTTIHAHKMFLCSFNTYFRGSCENMTALIRVPIMHFLDPAEAIRVLVRMLYGLPVPDMDVHPCGFLIDLAMAAKKYLEPDLSELAVDNFKDLACRMTEVKDVINMIDIAESHNDAELHEAATLVRKHHDLALLEDEGYLAAYACNPELVALHTVDLLAKYKDLAAKKDDLSVKLVLMKDRMRALRESRGRVRISH